MLRQLESCIPTSVTLLYWPVGSKQMLLPQALLLLLLTAACTDRTHGTFRVEGSRSSRLSKLRSCTRLIDILPLTRTRLPLCCSDNHQRGQQLLILYHSICKGWQLCNKFI